MTVEVNTIAALAAIVGTGLMVITGLWHAAREIEHLKTTVELLSKTVDRLTQTVNTMLMRRTE